MNKEIIRNNGHFTLQCINEQFQVGKNVFDDSLTNFTYHNDKSEALKDFYKRTNEYLQKEIKKNKLSKFDYFERKI